MGFLPFFHFFAQITKRKAEDNTAWVLSSEMERDQVSLGVSDSPTHLGVRLALTKKDAAA